MSSITRRIFLRTSATAGAALATVSTPVLAGNEQQEHPELLRARDCLDAAVEEFRSAAEAVRRARAIYDDVAPEVPDELVVKGTVGGGLAEEEVDCEGRRVWQSTPVRSPRRIYTSGLIATFHGRNFGGRDRRSRWFKRLHDTALEYENGIRAAEEVSGIGKAIERRYFAIDRLRRLASNVTEITPHSLTGVVIKARVLDAYAQCGESSRPASGRDAHLPVPSTDQ